MGQNKKNTVGMRQKLKGKTSAKTRQHCTITHMTLFWTNVGL